MLYAMNLIITDIGWMPCKGMAASVLFFVVVLFFLTDLFERSSSDIDDLPPSDE